MKLTILTIESAKSSWCNEALEEYQKKLKHFCSFEVLYLRGGHSHRDDRNLKKEKDSENILKEIKPTDYVVLLDEGGQEIDSITFSKKLTQWMNTSQKRVIFVIGGAYGVDQKIKDRAQLSLRMSGWTLNHWVAQIVLCEQIYRGFTIIKNLPYHNS